MRLERIYTVRKDKVLIALRTPWNTIAATGVFPKKCPSSAIERWIEKQESKVFGIGVDRVLA